MPLAWLGTPLGRLRVEVDEDGAVTAAGWMDQGAEPAAESRSAARAAKQLDEYFRGLRQEFSLQLAPRGSEFELRVWREVGEIAFGCTRSYGFIASRLGEPSLSRAVGSANARNPIAILVPCHRVVAAGGRLAGYAGGLWRKRWLLDHEAGQLRLGFDRGAE